VCWWWKKDTAKPTKNQTQPESEEDEEERETEELIALDII
jgi:hypothetical protein